MSLRAKQAGALALLGLVLSACTRETPSEIGGPLLPPGDVQTFEVILEPAQWLVFDTAFSGYVKASESSIMVAARRFEGVTDANTLVRMGPKPTTIQVRDSAGTIRTDTLPRFAAGTLVIRIDTFSSTKGKARLGVFQTAQPFDAASATWTMRIDTGGLHLPWTTPGGTRGPVVGSTTWTPGMDSVSIAVDSQTVAALTNPADTTRGVLITVDSADAIVGARLRINSVVLHLPTRSTIRPDTTIDTTVGTSTFTFLFTPNPAAAFSSVRVSGVPAWRGILALREDLEDLLINCPQDASCSTRRLGDIHLNQAELLMRPTGSPPGFSPEDSIVVQARPLLRSPNVPLARSPIGEPIGTFRAPVAPTRFRDTDTGPEVPLPIGSFINAILTDTTSAASPIRPARNLALLTQPEAFTFGFAAFRPGPRLRLILTISPEQR